MSSLRDHRAKGVTRGVRISHRPASLVSSSARHSRVRSPQHRRAVLCRRTRRGDLVARRDRDVGPAQGLRVPIPRPPPSRRDRLLLTTLRLSGARIEELAQALGWRLTTVRQRLSILRTRGVARASALWYPERAGRPICLITHVSLRNPGLEAMRDFETWSRGDDRVVRADLVTGRCDYVLWSWHGDLRIAERWSQDIALRDEVRTCVSRPVRVLAGHTLIGAPIFTREADGCRPFGGTPASLGHDV